ncbi:hypothetical protein VTN02DRAFT_1213 [Thermoascus thermophilus]
MSTIKDPASSSTIHVNPRSLTASATVSTFVLVHPPNQKMDYSLLPQRWTPSERCAPRPRPRRGGYGRVDLPRAAAPATVRRAKKFTEPLSSVHLSLASRDPS